MLEKALVGNKKYWMFVFFLLVIIGLGFLTYLCQLSQGLGITGMSRDVSWGLYIAQFTFLVGVAASAVMVVLPYYLHDYKAFGKLTVLGEFLAIASVIMCMLFIFVDMGQPFRAFNMILHPTPGSVMFWDMVSLGGYLLLNMLIGWTCLEAERKSVPPPKWIKPFIYLSIPWAVSIHTVTAFLYCGIGGRSFWFTAIMAPRFLSSAFSAGPALLIIFALIIRRISHFKPGYEPIQKLAQIVTYAICINVFFVLLEIFTVFYSAIPEHMHHFKYLFVGLHGHTGLVPWMWASTVLCLFAIVLLVNPKTRKKEHLLVIACVAVFIGTWIDKGMGLVVTGFIPNPFDTVTEYMPTYREVLIALGVYGIGALIITVLYKIVLAIRDREIAN
ncbi:MAG: polysulfide reductase NrfD [Deltaproteobacteria bacterium]|nr:polysulfide reductase NrfD [Deltaproteobacteria bacterium]